MYVVPTHMANLRGNAATMLPYFSSNVFFSVISVISVVSAFYERFRGLM